LRLLIFASTNNRVRFCANNEKKKMTSGKGKKKECNHYTQRIGRCGATESENIEDGQNKVNLGNTLVLLIRN